MNNFPHLFWITGLSASGKTTTAKALVDALKQQGQQPILLDGDELRAALGKEGSLSRQDRLELAYIYARLGKLLHEQGLTVVVATISMFEEVRQWNRKNIKNYLEVYLKISEEERIKRNPKGLYSFSSNHSMVAIDEKGFEEPKEPDLIFEDKDQFSLENIANKILEKYKERIKE